LTFAFKSQEARTPVTLSTFFLTFWDIDNGEVGANEKLYIDDLRVTT